MGLFLLVGAVVGVVVAAGRGGLAVAAPGGVMIGLLGWLLVSLTLARRCSRGRPLCGRRPTRLVPIGRWSPTCCTEG